MPDETNVVESDELAKQAEYKPERDELGRLLPGNSGNPSGRPKGSVSLKRMLEVKMAEIPLGQTKTWAEQIVDSLMVNAIVKNDTAAMKLIMSYIDGNPLQGIEMTGKDGAPLTANSEAVKALTEKFDAFIREQDKQHPA